LKERTPGDAALARTALLSSGSQGTRDPIPYNVPMGPDDKICYCYHVSFRKLYNYARRNMPARASQLSECLGAGTGCGWCIPILQRIHESVQSGKIEPRIEMTPEQYAEARHNYIINKDPKNRFD
jgi:bacterioferritin-associated ferredoxin